MPPVFSHPQSKGRCPLAMLAASLVALFALWCDTGCEQGPHGTSRDCPVDYTVTVLNDTVPRFSWKPADCWLCRLTVTDEYGKTVWEVLGSGNSIEPPVCYGVTPRNATAAQPDTLFAGTRYHLRLHLLTPPWKERAVGSAWFRYLE